MEEKCENCEQCQLHIMEGDQRFGCFTSGLDCLVLIALILCAILVVVCWGC